MKPKFRPGQIVTMPTFTEPERVNGKIIKSGKRGYWVKIFGIKKTMFYFENELILQHGQCVEQLTTRGENDG